MGFYLSSLWRCIRRNKKDMQILIDLHAINDGVDLKNEKMKEKYKRINLLWLLQRLYEDGYKINTLEGAFIFDNKNKVVIDIGKPGVRPAPSTYLANSIFNCGANMAVIFVEEKYIAFTDRYFPAIYFSHMRRVRPLSIYRVIENYNYIVTREDEAKLDSLYFEAFEERYGVGAEPRSYLLGVKGEITKRYAAPAQKE